jgi:hypothetical protein
MNRPLVTAALVVLAVLFAPAAFAADDADCTQMTQVVTDSNQGAPYMVDAITRSELATEDCVSKTAGFNWSILADAAALNQGWHEILKSSFEKGFCGRPELAAIVKAGWTIVATWKTQDGEVFSTQVACP